METIGTRMTGSLQLKDAPSLSYECAYRVYQSASGVLFQAVFHHEGLTVHGRENTTLDAAVNSLDERLYGLSHFKHYRQIFPNERGRKDTVLLYQTG